MMPAMTSNTWAHGKMIGFDTETTGVDIESDRIVSASLIIIEPACAPTTYNWLIDPGIEIPEGASAVHGISTKQAREGGQAPDTAVGEIAAMLEEHWEPGGPPLVAFNGVFDLSLLDRELARHLGSQVDLTDRRVVCPLTLDRGVNRYRKGNRKLGTLCAAYGVELRNAHTADADTLATLRLAYKIATRYPVEVGTVGLATLQAMQARWHREWAVSFSAYLQRQAVMIESDWVDGQQRKVAVALKLEDGIEPDADMVAAYCAQTRERAAGVAASAGRWPMIPRPVAATSS